MNLAFVIVKKKGEKDFVVHIALGRMFHSYFLSSSYGLYLWLGSLGVAEGTFPNSNMRIMRVEEEGLIFHVEKLKGM